MTKKTFTFSLTILSVLLLGAGLIAGIYYLYMYTLVSHTYFYPLTPQAQSHAKKLCFTRPGPYSLGYYRSEGKTLSATSAYKEMNAQIKSQKLHTYNNKVYLVCGSHWTRGNYITLSQSQSNLEIALTSNT